MRRRLRLVALLLLGATLVSCDQAAGETGQPGAPISEATPSPPTPDPLLQTTSLPQHGSD